jgi:hypothetical protein
MLNSLLPAVSLAGLLSAQAVAQEINVYPSANYSYGTMSPGGRVNTYNQYSSFSYGTISPGGQLNMYDHNERYGPGKTTHGDE